MSKEVINIIFGFEKMISFYILNEENSLDRKNKCSRADCCFRFLEVAAILNSCSFSRFLNDPRHAGIPEVQGWRIQSSFGSLSVTIMFCRVVMSEITTRSRYL